MFCQSFGTQEISNQNMEAGQVKHIFEFCLDINGFPTSTSAALALEEQFELS